MMILYSKQNTWLVMMTYMKLTGLMADREVRLVIEWLRWDKLTMIQKVVQSGFPDSSGLPEPGSQMLNTQTRNMTSGCSE